MMSKFVRHFGTVIVGFVGCASACTHSHGPAQAKLDSALLDALDNGQHARLTALLKRGANPNAKLNDRGRTALMEASGWGVEYEIRALVRYGAQKDATDLDGQTPLMYAVGKGRCDNVHVLVRLGADPRPWDIAGKSALGMAEAGLSGNWTTPFLHVGADERRACWRRIVRDLRRACSRRGTSSNRGVRKRIRGVTSKSHRASQQRV